MITRLLRRLFFGRPAPGTPLAVHWGCRPPVAAVRNGDLWLEAPGDTMHVLRDGAWRVL